MRLFFGQRAWVLQRVTALILLAFVVAIGIRLVAGPRLGYAEWQALASSTHGAVLTVLFFAALCLHAWVGVRDVLIDYVKAPGLRLGLLAVTGFILSAVMVRVLLVMASRFAAS